VEESDVVLMDLRSFAPANRGRVYELGELVDAIDLARVVFVVDRSTDRGFLEGTLRELWRKIDRASPNRRSPVPIARLLAVERSDAAEIRRVLAMLLGAAGADRGRAADEAAPVPKPALLR
jgi:hypothetical protein